LKKSQISENNLAEVVNKLSVDIKSSTEKLKNTEKNFEQQINQLKKILGWFKNKIWRMFRKRKKKIK